MSYQKTIKNLALTIFVVWLIVFDFRIYQEKAFAADYAEDIKEDIEKVQSKAEKVKKELNTSQTLLQKKNVELGVTKNLLQKTQSEIGRKEVEVNNLNQRIKLSREMLEGYILEAYYADEDPLSGLLLGDVRDYGMSGDFDQILNVKERIVLTLGEIKKAKEDVAKTKEELDSKKEDHEKLITIQQSQQVEIKTDINQAQATLSELNAKIDKLKSELSSLLTTAVSFKNVTDAATFAAKVTGIRKDYLLGVLVVESNLGRYTGGCNFKESRMSGYRASVFKEICNELKYDYNKQKVSCPPKGYKGTGGAMGVAQFMPDTWAGYKSSIASVTGHKTPDPWSLTDGVVAMALKLTKVDGVKEHKKSAEAKAYCVYLAGGNWPAYCDSKGVNYGEKVLYWADNYERVMN
jgi:outer membrane murein-binding lipoprotein Lpp